MKIEMKHGNVFVYARKSVIVEFSLRETKFEKEVYQGQGTQVMILLTD